MNRLILKENTLIDNRYTVLKKLGSGACGTVYLIYDNKVGRKLALKLAGGLTPEELMTLRSIHHPAFPSITDTVTVKDCTGLIMDYIAGCTLDEYTRIHDMTIEETYSCALEIAQALEYLHSMTPTVLYMDCKPSNIIMGDDGHPHLIDLGSAYICGVSNRRHISGTLPYAAPEQRLLKEPDIRTDIYSYGMTLLKLTGLTYSDNIGSFFRYRKDKRAVLSHIICACTREKPDKRYQSMGAVIHHLTDPGSIVPEKPAPIHIFRRLADLTYKHTVTAFSILSFHMYADSRNLSYLCLGAFLYLLLISLSLRRRPSDRPVLWQCNRDVFLGSLGPTVLLVMICCLLTAHYSKAKDNLPKVVIYDETGSMVLYRGQYLTEEGDNLYLCIPTESLSKGHLPARVEILPP